MLYILSLSSSNVRVTGSDVLTCSTVITTANRYSTITNFTPASKDEAGTRRLSRKKPRVATTATYIPSLASRKKVKSGPHSKKSRIFSDPQSFARTTAVTQAAIAIFVVVMVLAMALVAAR